MKSVKKSLKPVPLSLRGKKRYILFELIAEGRLGSVQVQKALMQCFAELFGSAGIAKQKLQFILFDSGKGILRCSLESVEEAKAGILFLQKVQNREVIPCILSVSGSVKKLKQLLRR